MPDAQDADAAPPPAPTVISVPAPPARPKRHVAGAIVAFAMFACVYGFLLIFPTVSAVGLITSKPVTVTITDCWHGTGRRGHDGCRGTWTDDDGRTRDDKVTSWPDSYEEGQVVDGYVVLGQGTLSRVPWILDVVLVYPFTIAGVWFFVHHFRKARRTTRAHKADLAAEERAANERAEALRRLRERGDPIA